MKLMKLENIESAKIFAIFIYFYGKANAKYSKAIVEKTQNAYEFRVKTHQTENLFKYFGYGYYWIGPGAWGEFAHPNELVELQRAEESETENPKKSTNHLRAVGEVGGYEVATTTDNVGHISNFVIDTESWKIIMLVVDTNNWLPGDKHLALLPSDIESIDWAAHSVVVNLSHDELVDRPEVESEKISEEGYVPMLCEQLNKNGN